MYHPGQTGRDKAIKSRTVLDVPGTVDTYVTRFRGQLAPMLLVVKIFIIRAVKITAKVIARMKTTMHDWLAGMKRRTSLSSCTAQNIFIRAYLTVTV